VLIDDRLHEELLAVLRQQEMVVGTLRPAVHDGGRPFGERLDEVAAFIRRYVVLRPEQLVAVTLWIAHCHAIKAFYTTGRLLLRSPEPECGKSLLFDVMETLVPPDPILDVSISPAALYRSLDENNPPVVMLDEIDKTIGRSGSAESESLSLLVAVVNGGYRRGRTVRRCVGSGHVVVKFPIFAPVALAGISPKLDRAALTRSIVIEMQRRAPDEPVDEFVAWDAVPAGEALRDELISWASANVDNLQRARPYRPAGIVNRLAECWSPLLAIAEAAGGHWVDDARNAATTLAGVGHHQDHASVGQRVLAAVYRAFGEREVLWTADLLDALNSDDEAPWVKWNNGQGVRASDLANRFRDYDIHRSADIKIAGTTRKGYRRAWFAEAWKRYLSPNEHETPVAKNDPAIDNSETLPRYFPASEQVPQVATPRQVAAAEVREPAPAAEGSEVAANASLREQDNPLPPPDLGAWTADNAYDEHQRARERGVEAAYDP
jgi:hypothetical protein